MKRIAVVTSGGDAPGMNAAIRAVVRTGLGYGAEVYGVRRGYAGLIEGDFVPLRARDVGGIIQQGGTILGSARCSEFKATEGRARALSMLRAREIEGLIVVGGDGSQRGSHLFCSEGFPVVGVASTIDNDLYGTEMSIGVDSALNVALEAIDRLKVTASSHRRAFLVEVMGRNCGYLALMAGIAGGAEVIVIPEVETDPEEVAKELCGAYDRGKAHAIVVVAEGAQFNAHGLSNYFREHQERLGFELRLTTLGHVQRGGAPGAFDRLLATRLAVTATERLLKNECGVLIGLREGKISATPLAEVAVGKKPLDLTLMESARILAQ
jgi:6-phosphofructokinase 1